MKKIFYVWLFLATFFIFSQDVFASEITDDDLLQDCLTPIENSNYNINCFSFGLGTAKYDSTELNYSPTNLVTRVTGQWLDFGSVYSSDVEVGPPTIYPSFAYYIGTSGTVSSSTNSSLLTYHLVKELPYKLVYTFFLNRSVDLTDFSLNFDEENPNFIYHAKAVNIENNTLYDEDVFSKFFVNTTLNEETRRITIEFSFVPKDNFDEFGFYIGSDNFNDFDLSFTRFLSNFSTEMQPLQYIDFKLYQTGELDDSGADIIDIDKVSSKDESIFSQLKQCETLDIGCHVDNILTMIKNIFVRIGNFFVSILEFFATIFIKLGELLTNLFVPDTSDINSIFDTLSTFLNNKLGFLMFPFDFIIDFLNRFVSLPNDPVKEISVSAIKIGDFGTLIPAFSFNVAEYWEKAPFNQIYNIYLIFVHAFIGFGLYKLSLNKFNEIVGGAKN